MTENGKTVPPTPGIIIWGRDIKRPLPVQPPPKVVPYLQGLAAGLNGFAGQRRRSIEYHIQFFELDRESMRERRPFSKDDAANPAQANRNVQQEGEEYMKPYNINKALTLELMMTCAMYRLLSPVCARSNCRLSYRWPVNFAPPGHPDIVVDCGGFVFHVEVSAKIDVDDDYFGDELTGTLNHMKSQDVNYALLITEWDYKKARNSEAYKAFKSNNQKDLDRHHLVIMSLQEMAELSATLAFDPDFNSGGKRLKPAQVRTLFEALHAAQETKEKKKPTQKQTRKGKKQTPEKEKKVEINLRDTWIKTTQRLLKE